MLRGFFRLFRTVVFPIRLVRRHGTESPFSDGDGGTDRQSRHQLAAFGFRASIHIKDDVFSLN